MDFSGTNSINMKPIFTAGYPFQGKIFKFILSFLFFNWYRTVWFGLFRTDWFGRFRTVWFELYILSDSDNIIPSDSGSDKIIWLLWQKSSWLFSVFVKLHRKIYGSTRKKLLSTEINHKVQQIIHAWSSWTDDGIIYGIPYYGNIMYSDGEWDIAVVTAQTLDSIETKKKLSEFKIEIGQ